MHRRRGDADPFCLRDLKMCLESLNNVERKNGREVVDHRDAPEKNAVKLVIVKMPINPSYSSFLLLIEWYATLFRKIRTFF